MLSSVDCISSCYSVQGVSVVRYCDCGAPALQCPVKWDQFDGKSITQSQSDQYKVGRTGHSSQVIAY